MARRKIPPMPIENIAENARLMALPVAGYGMALKLLIHFWLTECRPLPSHDSQLYVLCHAHKATWAQHKAEIKAILNELTPCLKKAWDIRAAGLTHLKRLSDRGQAVKVARAHAEKRALAGDLFEGAVAPKRDQANKAATIVTPAPKPGGKGFKDKAA